MASLAFKTFKKTALIATIGTILVAGGMSTPAMARDDGGASGGTATGCNTTGCGTGGGHSMNNSNSNKNNITAVFAAPAAAAVGAGCTAVTGFNVGAGVAGIGLTFSNSSVDEKFFVKCNNYEQVNMILQSDPCLGLPAAANGAPEAGYPGNPMIANALKSPQGQAHYNNMCPASATRVTVNALKPRG